MEDHSGLIYAKITAYILEQMYSNAIKIMVVEDKLSAYKSARLYELYEPPRARNIIKNLEILKFNFYMKIQEKDVIDALVQNNFSKALSLVQQLEHENPEDVGIKILFGKVFLKMSNFTMAYEKYMQAMKIDPTNSKVYIKLGLAGIQLEKWEQSLNHFKTAINIDPDDFENHGHYGWALWAYGALKEDWAIMSEAYTYLSKAKSNGVELPVINNALAAYHIENATSSWPQVQGKDGPIVCATKLDHIVEAKEELEEASNLISDSSVDLKNRYNEVYTFVTSLEERKFNGYPFVRKVGIIAGVLLFLFGIYFGAIVLLIMVALYHHSNMSTGYIANRDYLKERHKEPFWIRRIDAVEKAASNFRSISRSSSEDWIITLSSLLMQYLMVIFLMPFLIVSGYVKNYDLLKKVKQYTST
ncbi:MAG: hypothetical protein R2828_00900 [Saprospiraceae bacterium]